MTSKLKINIETRGEHTTRPGKPIHYNVKMSEPELQSGDLMYLPPTSLQPGDVLYFPSTLALTKKDIRNAKTGIAETKIFMNPTNLDEVMRYIVNKKSKKTPTKKAKEEDVAFRNIKLLKSIYFPSRGKFFIDGKAYIINKSEVVKDSIKMKNVDPVTGVSEEYNVTIKLSLLDARKNPGFIDFQRLSCKDKAEKIDSMAKELLGVSFGLYKETTDPHNIRRPVLFSGEKTGYTGDVPPPPYTTKVATAPPYEPSGGTRSKRRRRRKRKTRRKRH